MIPEPQLREMLLDAIDIERFKGPTDLDDRVVRHFDAIFRRLHQAGHLGRKPNTPGPPPYTIVIAEPGVIEIWLRPEPKRPQRLTLRIV